MIGKKKSCTFQKYINHFDTLNRFEMTRDCRSPIFSRFYPYLIPMYFHKSLKSPLLTTKPIPERKKWNFLALIIIIILRIYIAHFWVVPTQCALVVFQL